MSFPRCWNMYLKIYLPIKKSRILNLSKIRCNARTGISLILLCFRPEPLHNYYTWITTFLVLSPVDQVFQLSAFDHQDRSNSFQHDKYQYHPKISIFTLTLIRKATTNTEGKRMALKTLKKNGKVRPGVQLWIILHGTIF